MMAASGPGGERSEAKVNGLKKAPFSESAPFFVLSRAAEQKSTYGLDDRRNFRPFQPIFSWAFKLSFCFLNTEVAYSVQQSEWEELNGNLAVLAVGDASRGLADPGLSGDEKLQALKSYE